MPPTNLYVQDFGENTPARPVVLGEVLWDVFPDSARLGGAPLNFAAHAMRMGHAPLLISGVGRDELGRQALSEIEALGLDTSLIQSTNLLPTGTAGVTLDSLGEAEFRIERPAAYDAVILTSQDIELVQNWAPDWLYFGTLYASLPEGRSLLLSLIRLIPEAVRFYDLNLRPGFESPTLICELLEEANVVKMNQDEMRILSRELGFSQEMEAFCQAASERFNWKAVCVTLGARGCAIFADGRFAYEAACRIEVADTVGAGDAFAAAFMNGLASKWEVAEIAKFANRVGALVASRPGAIPDWTPMEVAAL